MAFIRDAGQLFEHWKRRNHERQTKMHPRAGADGVSMKPVIILIALFITGCAALSPEYQSHSNAVTEYHKAKVNLSLAEADFERSDSKRVEAQNRFDAAKAAIEEVEW